MIFDQAQVADRTGRLDAAVPRNPDHTVTVVVHNPASVVVFALTTFDADVDEVSDLLVKVIQESVC